MQPVHLHLQGIAMDELLHEVEARVRLLEKQVAALEALLLKEGIIVKEEYDAAVKE